MARILTSSQSLQIISSIRGSVLLRDVADHCMISWDVSRGWAQKVRDARVFPCLISLSEARMTLYCQDEQTLGIPLV